MLIFRKFIALSIAFFSSLFLISCAEKGKINKEEKSLKSPYAFVEYPKQKYTNMYFGEIVPKGWLKNQIESDLKGFVGQLDELAPEIIVEDDIYGEDRRTDFTKGTDVSPNALAWWNSESQSNWWDGFIRSSILVNDQENLAKVERYIEDKLETQEENGYLGIYAEDLRYKKSGENADFWAQTTLLRGLLAYYEATKNPEVLQAIEDAVQRSMQAYPIEKSTPFKKLAVGHSLIFTDILDRLYQITGKTEYMEYALWLYKDYNRQRDTPKNKLAPDILLDSVLDPNYRLQGHGVHTYELFRALVTAYYASGNPILKKGIDAYLQKIALVESPSGGPSGDEWIFKRSANATEVGYEYCSIHELLDSYGFLLQKSGNLHLADKMEWLLFNAGQGARLPNGKGIAYCKTDNSYSMTGPLHFEEETDELRYKYSPVHQDVAVCCAPNAGRIYPYYVQAMWLKKEDGVLAALYGPNTLKTEINGVHVKIDQKTKYPFNHSITFIIRPEKPVSFEFSFRKPRWANNMSVNGTKISETAIRDQVYTLKKTWKKGDTIKIAFDTAIKINEDRLGDTFISYGPLVYAHPIEAEKISYKTYENSNLKDLFFKPSQETYTVYELLANSRLTLIKKKYTKSKPWNSLAIEGKFWNTEKNRIETLQLVPMGGTVLRQVTFPKPPAVKDSVLSGNGTP